MTQQEKQDKKQYEQTNKKYKKQLKKLLKQYGPWDNFIGEFVRIQIEHWVEYYSLGYNVFAEEIVGLPTRLQIALRLKELYEKYTDFDCFNEKYRLDDNTLDVDKIKKDYLKTKKAFFDYYFKYTPEMWD